MTNAPTIFIFNSSLSSGCDYVKQTIRIVAKNNPVYGFALGDIISFPKWLFGKDRWIVRMIDEAVIIRPISIIPGVRFRIVKQCTYIVGACMLRVWISIKHVGQKKVLWFFEPFYMPSLIPIFRGYKTIYDCVDYYPGFNTLAATEHTKVVNLAEYVFANSQPLANQLKKYRPDVHQVPLGFAHDVFSVRTIKPLSPSSKKLTVGLVGSISDRMDFDLLASTIKQLSWVHFVFVGPIEVDVFGSRGSASESFKKLLRSKNVEWKKPVAKRMVPKIISQFDVGMIPYRVDNSFNKYSFPMKSLEYFTMGKPVISTDILSLRAFANKRLLTIVKSVQEFVSAVYTIQQRGWNKSKQKRQLAAAFSQNWEMKIAAIYAALGLNGSINEK